MPPVRILVLTSSTGGGHDARAQAFAEWVYYLYRKSVDVRIEQMLEGSSIIGRVGVSLYNGIQRRMPILHNPYFMMIEGLSVLNRRTVTFGRRFYRDTLESYRPHLVFSVHDCLNRGYFQMARGILGPENVRCATYCGEFSGGFGYSRNWVEPTVDLYLSRTQTAQDYALKLGLPPERARVRGNLLRPRAYHEIFTKEEVRRYRRDVLDLAPDRFTVLLGTGGAGANNHMALLPILARYADRVQAVVVCGTNLETYNQILQWRTSQPEFLCAVEGYTEVMHYLLQASDAVVTRGGTTTCSKALHFRCPIILNAMGGIMPQERLTAKFFLNGDGARLISRPEDFADILARWMEDPNEHASLRRRFERLRYADDPAKLIHDLVALAQDAAGVRVESRHPF